MVIVDKIIKLCNENKVSITYLEIQLGLGRGSIRQWEQRHPRAEAIGRVANFFDISADWLIGTSDTRYRIEDMFEGEIIAIQRARNTLGLNDQPRMMDILKIGFDNAFKDKE